MRQPRYDGCADIEQVYVGLDGTTYGPKSDRLTIGRPGYPCYLKVCLEFCQSRTVATNDVDNPDGETGERNLETVGRP